MTLVHQMLQIAKTHWASHWDRTGDEQRLRLAGIEQEMRKIVSALVEGLWEVMAGYLDAVAEGQSRMCGCGRRCERQNHDLRLTVLGIAVLFSVPYFYCRVCKKGTSPVRRWLGLEAGGVSMELERKTTDLTTRMTFGDAVDSLHEQHGHEMDRTQAERITYAVGKEATPYLDEWRHVTLPRPAVLATARAADELAVRVVELNTVVSWTDTTIPRAFSAAPPLPMNHRGSRASSAPGIEGPFSRQSITHSNHRRSHPRTPRRLPAAQRHVILDVPQK
jgi:hypothetical protein